ncbi:hypothetical protein [Colwellia echini]|uniref:Uncharacterized protein n=1 Tax=Colwellia echini TaxID=1982103 RepID=A0ABY3MVH0_9GAMM|nr:hypothetical protein [Colwellia echini]TYK65082.1 hypothetical protein CWS31_012360 [Colwellia echini]
MLVLLTSIVIFSYNYMLALSIAVVGLVSCGLWLSSDNTRSISGCLLVDNTGDIQLFDKPLLAKCTTTDLTCLAVNHYQLLAHSRFSFFGCWLVMVPKNNDASSQTQLFDLTQHQKRIAKQRPKQVFLFRDSVSGQDFSRLARVVRQL